MRAPPEHDDIDDRRWKLHASLRKIRDRIELAPPSEDGTPPRDVTAGILLRALALARAADLHPEVDRALLHGKGHEVRVRDALRTVDARLADAILPDIEPAKDLHAIVSDIPSSLRRASREELALAARTIVGWRRATSIDEDVVTLMARLAQPMDGELLFDPDCGDGVLVSMAAHELSQDSDRRVRVEARASSEEQVATARVVAFLHDLDAHVELGDGPQLSLDARDRTRPRVYPRVISFVEEPRSREERSLWPSITRILPLLESGGRAVLLLATRAPLFHKRDAEQRRAMLDRNVVRAVIELPTVRWSRTAHRAGAILVLEERDPARPAPQIVAFARLATPEDDEPLSLDVDLSLRALQEADSASEALVIERVALDTLLSDDNLEPSHWIRTDAAPSVEAARAALEAAEKEERAATMEAEEALARYLKGQT